MLNIRSHTLDATLFFNQDASIMNMQEKPKRQILRAQSAGFCWGVERAIDIARDIALNKQKPVFTDGPLIHNKHMVTQLEAEGVHELGDYQSKSELHIDEDAKEDAVMVVRAHGISPERRKYLKSLDLKFKDATCPDVGIIAGKIKLHSRKGYHTVIFGDPQHPEVIGLMGYTEDRGHVVQTTEDVQSLPAMGDKVCMVSQSTMFTHEFKKLAACLAESHPEAVVIDTICNATKERQGDVIKLKAEGCEAIVVIGGSHSANTMKLAKLAEAQNLPTFHVESAKDLDLTAISRYNPIGVTAGASTPEFLIDEVCKKLEALPIEEPVLA